MTLGGKKPWSYGFVKKLPERKAPLIQTPDQLSSDWCRTPLHL